MSESIFPMPFPDGSDNHKGITMRDYFAAKAMQSIFGGIGAAQVADRDDRYDETNWKEVIAMNSYEMANAMIEERKKYYD